MEASQLHSPIGLVAGNGSFPVEFAKNAAEKNLRVIAIAYHRETDPELETLVDQCTWIRVGQFGKLIRALKKAAVQEVAFAGGITRARFFRDIRLDLRALALIARVGSVRDERILRAIVGEVEREGIQVVPASVLLKESVPPVGLLTKRDLTEKEWEDARIGWKVCAAVGAEEIGQTVVVSKGMVVAVEAIEGTDQAIRRAGELSGRGAVVVKRPRPDQDLRIDMPVIGPKTLESMEAAESGALLLEAGKTLMLNPVEFVQEADRLGIAVRLVDDLD